jgi:hypothetical protein
MLHFDVPEMKQNSAKVCRKVRKVLPFGDFAINGDGSMIVRFPTVEDALMFGKGRLPGVDLLAFEQLTQQLGIDSVTIAAGGFLVGKLVLK